MLALQERLINWRRPGLQSIHPHLASSTAQAAGFQSSPRPLRSALSPTSTDLRSAAILTKKESIEQVSPAQARACGTGHGQENSQELQNPRGKKAMLGDGRALGQLSTQVLWEEAASSGTQGEKVPFVLLAGRFWAASC